MNLKKILLGITMFATLFTSYAQEKKVEIKDNKILINGVVALKYEKISSIEHSFYTLDDDEILMYKYNSNETPSYAADDYMILNFLTLKTKIESNDVSKSLAGLGMNTKKNMEKLVTWLLKEKVINEKGELNPERLEIFYDKYHENITDRTFR